MKKLPQECDFLIVGGGVIGCSIAYFLAKKKRGPVVLLEKGEIASGSSWHAAGIITELRNTESSTHFCKVTNEILPQLREDSQHNFHYRNSGALFVTHLKDRLNQFKMQVTLGKTFGVEANLISPVEAKKLWPLLNTKDLIASLWVPGDGLVDPEQLTIAYQKAAEKWGAQVITGMEMLDVKNQKREVEAVITNRGEIKTKNLIIATGIWSQSLSQSLNMNLPLFPTQHYYIITTPLNGVNAKLPLLRDLDARSYVRSIEGMRWSGTTNRLLCGFFEEEAHPWDIEKIPPDFQFGQLPPDKKHLNEIFKKLKKRIPVLKKTPIETYVNAPESFTYDNHYLFGQHPHKDNLYVATGFNSRGIQSSGGIGKVLADWITKGKNGRKAIPLDLQDVDIRRVPRHTANRAYLRNRAKEILGLLYSIPYPYLQLQSSRGLKTSPLQDKLVSLGACMGELGGWERANWFASHPKLANYQHSFFKQNWFPSLVKEHHAVRNNVGIFDQTSFAKFLIQGHDATNFLNRICSSQMDVIIGKVVYTQVLNEWGGIEADVTITRLEENSFMLLSTVTSQTRDFKYLQKNIKGKERVVITDITSSLVVLAIMGPNSRKLMEKLSDANFSHSDFPFATSKEINLALARIRATRITYVGELGYELYIPTENAKHCFDAIWEQGKKFSLKLAGYHALNALRLEKGYLHWGHDMSELDTPFEAGVGFTVHFKSKGNFLGRKNLFAQKKEGVSKRLVFFKLLTKHPHLHQYEPIYRNQKKIGFITSGMFSPQFKTSLAIGMIKNDNGMVDDEFINKGNYEIEFLNKKYPAVVSKKPFYDPARKKILC